MKLLKNGFSYKILYTSLKGQCPLFGGHYARIILTRLYVAQAERMCCPTCTIKALFNFLKTNANADGPRLKMVQLHDFFNFAMMWKLIHIINYMR